MCVTKHLAATVRTVRHLKFLSRIVKQERFLLSSLFPIAITVISHCILVESVFVWLRLIELGIANMCITSEMCAMGFDHDDHSTLPNRSTFDMSFDHLRMKNIVIANN